MRGMASRDKIEKYSVPEEDMEDEDETQTLEEARERGDWLFICLSVCLSV